MCDCFSPKYTYIGDDWNVKHEQEYLAQAKKEAEECDKELGEHDWVKCP